MSDINTACPICDAQIQLNNKVEESEILNCTDCHSRLVVEKVENNNITLSEAPEVEEDWGE